MRRIPTFNDPFYNVKTQFDGAQYQLTFRWNHRTSTWSFDLFQTDGTPIRYGVKIVPNTFLLLPSHYIDGCPPGEIYCVSHNPADDSPPGLNDLVQGGRCELVYLPMLDMIALLNATGPQDLGSGG